MRLFNSGFPRRRLARGAWWIAGVVLLMLEASQPIVNAQWPTPRLLALSTTGGQIGSTTEVTLTGSDLEGATTLWFDHPGLRGFHLKGLTFKVVIAPETPLGPHDLRVVGTYGVSNSRLFVVSDLPDSAEVEPNQSIAQAQSVLFPGVINAQINPAADLDYFAIQAKRGQRLFIEVQAARLDSRLDASLRVLRSNGSLLAESQDVFGADPFLDVTFPDDGRYFIQIHDVIYQGSLEFPYRLVMTESYLDAAVPGLFTRGATAEARIVGRGISGKLDPSFQADGRPLEWFTAKLNAPSSAQSFAGRWLRSPVSAATPGWDWRWSAPTNSLPRDKARLSNPLFLVLADDPVVVEVEPNDGSEQVQVVSPPCEISGSFGKRGDVDVYRFAAKPGDLWWIEADAEAIGSNADPRFVVQKVVPNAGPREEGEAEDTPDRGAASRFFSGSVDASLRKEIKEEGQYQVVLSDLFNSQRGDVRLRYRLRIRKEQPDFRAFLLPQDPAQPEGINLRAGGRQAALAHVWRLHGFNRPVRIEARSLPAGVRMEPVYLGPGQSLAPLVFEAGESVKPGLSPIELVASSRFGDRREDHDLFGRENLKGPDLVQPLIAAGFVWPNAAPGQSQPSFARVESGPLIAMLDADPLRLTVDRPRQVVAQGRSMTLPITVERRLGFTEAMTVTATDLPPNLATASVTIAKEAASATLTLPVAKNVPPGVYTFLLRGAGPYPFSKDPNAKQKPNINLNVPSNPITLVVRPLNATITVDAKGGMIAAGKTHLIEVKVARQNGYAGPVEISLVSPAAAKLTATAVRLEADQTAATLSITAAAESPAGAIAGAAVRAATSAPEGGPPTELEEPINLVVLKN